MSIKSCPITVEEFPAWRRKTEAELRVIGLDQHLLKSFREITISEWKRKFSDDYQAEVNLLTLSGVSAKDIEEIIIPEGVGTDSYCSTESFIDFRAVKKVLSSNGTKVKIKSIKKGFQKLLERKTDLIKVKLFEKPTFCQKTVHFFSRVFSM